MVVYHGGLLWLMGMILLWFIIGIIRHGLIIGMISMVNNRDAG